MYRKKHRIMAWICVCLLLLLHVINFVVGISSSKDTMPLFLATMLATFFLPIMLYFYLRFASFRAHREEEDEEENDKNSGKR